MYNKIIKTSKKRISENSKYNKPLLKYENSYNVEKYYKTLPVSEYYRDYVNFNHTSSCCRKCDVYNKNWSCPEFNFNIKDYWSKYENIDLTLLKLTFDEDICQNRYTNEEIDTILHLSLFKEKNHLIKELIRQEAEKSGILLSTGYCNLCPVCNKIYDKPCKYPNHKRNSIESVGGLVVKSAKELFSEDIEWIDTKRGIIPQNLMLMTALLY